MFVSRYHDPRFASRAVLILAAVLTVACGVQEGSSPAKPVPAAPAADKYDASKMDLSPRPSKTAQGGGPAAVAPNAGAVALPGVPPVPADAGPATIVARIDVTNEVVEVAPGVKFAAWAFGGTVPGPTVRARVGDVIRFVMTNRSAEPVNGVQVGVPMPHSMDFHAAMVSPQDKYHSILPGETIEFEFTANYPGVFMYHCGTPMILEHLVAGMYGMTIVTPREGYPTKVDREYAVVQGEFYLKSGGKDGLSVLDMDKARSKDATQVTFNGHVDALRGHPLSAKPGERVRLYVLNVGPSGTSSFHVVGTIFDRVWIEGNPDNQFRGMQTVLLGASNSAIVEFVIPEAGKYIMVDHEFADATKGAIGLIDATDSAGATGAAPAPVESDADKGKKLFAASACQACHVPVAGAQRIAPDLAGVTSRRSDEWLTRWLADPNAMIATDPAAKQMLETWKVTMPPPGFSPEQIRQMIAHLHAQDGSPGHGAHDGH